MPPTPEQRLGAKFPTFAKNARALAEPERSRVFALADLLAELADRLHETAPGKELQARSLEVASFATAVAGHGAIDPRWEPARRALREAGVTLGMLMGYVDGLIAGHLRPQVRDWAQFRQHARQTAFAPGVMMLLALGAEAAKIESRRPELEAFAQQWALAAALWGLSSDASRGRTLIPHVGEGESSISPEELYSRNLSENAKSFYKQLAERGPSIAAADQLLRELLPPGAALKFAQASLAQHYKVFTIARETPGRLLEPVKSGGWLARLLQRG